MEKELLECLKAIDLPECNPQYQPFDGLDECPAGHKYECGGCVLRRRVLAAIAKADAGT